MWTWPDFFIVHFTGHNRDVDVGEQDINRPTWHLTKKKSTLNMVFCVVLSTVARLLLLRSFTYHGWLRTIHDPGTWGWGTHYPPLWRDSLLKGL